MVLVIGHRGASGYYPENTLLSFNEAVKQGADMIELDIHLTKDDEIVVIHDGTVDRTTDGTGTIGNLSLKEVRGLDAGSGERVPTLDEVLSELMGNCSLDVELKGKDTAIPVLKILEGQVRKGRWRSDDLMISSFSPIDLLELYNTNCSIEMAVLIDNDPWGSEDFAMEIGARSVHPNFMSLDTDFITRCRGLDLKINTWTVNEPSRMLELVEWGVDGIITDHPDILVERIGSLR